MRRVLFRNKSVQSLELDDISKFEAGADLGGALLRKPELCLLSLSELSLPRWGPAYCASLVHARI